MKSSKQLKLPLPDKENQGQASEETLPTHRSCKVLTDQESNQQREAADRSTIVVDLSQEQIVKEYSSNPFFRKQLHYLIKTSLKYNPKMEVEDYECSADFQTASHSQQESDYLRNDIGKLHRLMPALGIDRHHPALK